MVPARAEGEVARVQQGGAMIKGVHAPVVLVSDRDAHGLQTEQDFGGREEASDASPYTPNVWRINTTNINNTCAPFKNSRFLKDPDDYQ